MRTHLATYLVLVLGLIWLSKGDFVRGTDRSLASQRRQGRLGPRFGVSREDTPTGQRVCLNGLWRWQPATAAETNVPAGELGSSKRCPWPGPE